MTSVGPIGSHQTPQIQNAALKKAAKQLEATFLAEMLKSAGFAKARDAFGGGVGEDQFSSLLLQAQAEKMVEGGGIGLAEQLYESLKDKQND